MKLKVMVRGVSDVDRAKAKYQRLDWRFDNDTVTGNFRCVQMQVESQP